MSTETTGGEGLVPFRKKNGGGILHSKSKFAATRELIVSR